MNKKKGTREKGLSGHMITLHQRLYHALDLGFRFSDNKERQWQSNDADIQRLAVRSISAFLDGISPEIIQLPLVKDSVPDIVRALEGILQLKNETLLTMTSAVAVKLVSILPNSVLQPHAHFVHPLSSLLSFHQSQVAVYCATALRFIISNLSAKHEKRVWEILRETDAVSQIISKLQYFNDGAKSTEYVLELASLLSVILQRWPSSRYPVWSDDKLMKTLKVLCLRPDSSIKVAMFQLFTALALCGYGAKKLLDDRDLLEVTVDCMGKSYPHSIRIQAFRAVRTLMVSEQGCSEMLVLYSEPITKSIISGMTGWTLNSGEIYRDDMSLLVESCQNLALITRQPGKHHDLLWKLGIEKVLFDLTLNFQRTHMLDESLSLEEIITVTREGLDANFLLVLRPFVWGIVGWLVAHCDAEHIPKILRSKLYLKILITTTCLAFVDSIGRKRQIFQADPANIYWIVEAAKTTLLMMYSPCKVVASHARSVLAKVLEIDGKGFLKILLHSTKFSSSTGNSLITNKFQIVINMIGLACYSGMPEFYKEVIQDGGTKILLNFVRQWFDNSNQCQRIGLASNLQLFSDERSCCRFNNEEWEGTETTLLLAMWSLSELFRLSSSEGVQMDIFAGQTVYNKEQFISDLQGISVSATSSGSRWHASYLLSFLGVYGFTNKLGIRIGQALGEKEIADVKMLLKSGECLSVHGVVLLVRCPSLLPPRELPDEEKRHLHTFAKQATGGSSRAHKEVTLSAQVDLQALEKLLDFIYAGYAQVEEELVRKLKIFSRHCNLQSLLQLLSGKRPKWGDPFPNFDLTSALGPSGLDFSDVILEAKSAQQQDWKCSFCSLSAPHMHSHKIILLSSCEYMRALFQSGMQESHSQTLHVPVSLEALGKLAIWFYSGELPKPITSGCLWDNTDVERKMEELKPYIELCWLGEYWMLDDVQEECSWIVSSSIDNTTELAVKILQISAEFCQWKLVEFAAKAAGPYYPSLRESGALDCLDEELIDMIRAASVRLSQSCQGGSR